MRHGTAAVGGAPTSYHVAAASVSQGLPADNYPAVLSPMSVAFTLSDIFDQPAALIQLAEEAAASQVELPQSVMEPVQHAVTSPATVSASSSAVGAAAATQPSTRPRAVAPRKQPRPKSDLDRCAEAWPALPSVSTSDLYEVVKAMPDATPVQLADVIIRRYDLDTKKRFVLARRLSAIQHTRDTMKRELRELLPVGDLDGNSAIAAIRRVAAWLQGSGTSTARPFQ